MDRRTYQQKDGKTGKLTDWPPIQQTSHNRSLLQLNKCFFLNWLFTLYTASNFKYWKIFSFSFSVWIFLASTNLFISFPFPMILQDNFNTLNALHLMNIIHRMKYKMCIRLWYQHPVSLNAKKINPLDVHIFQIHKTVELNIV